MQARGSFEFTGHERRRIAAAMRETRDARYSRRLHAVWLVAQGHSARETAKLLGASERWVGKWMSRYRAHRRPEDLAGGRHTGRPRTATVLSKRSIVAAVKKDPLKLGYSSMVWTVPLLTTYLRGKYEVSLSERTVRRRMREAGLRWKRPRYVFAKKDPNRGQKKGGSSAS